MDYCKIIPCLDTKDGRLVKGVNFVELKEVGDPAENAAAYDEAGADELVFLDITATLENRKTFFDAVKRTVERIRIPLTVGGGIGSTDDIRRMIDLGVSKLSMNSAAVRNPQLVADAAKMFGSERITVAIDTRKNPSMPSGFEVVVRDITEEIIRASEARLNKALEIIVIAFCFRHFITNNDIQCCDLI